MSEYWIERRKSLRKKTNLEGYYWKTSPDAILGKIEKAIVIDLSVGGCCLSVPDAHDLHLNNPISLIFRLDNAERTKIKKDAVVLRVDGNNIGCKFASEHDMDILHYVQGEVSK